MVIDKLIIKNYKNYKETKVKFNEGINVIVGANNSGKTNILYVISLLTTNKKLTIDDFNKNVLYKEFNLYKDNPPVIVIEYFIKHNMNYNKIDSGFTRIEKFIKFNVDGNISLDETGTFEINAKVILKYELDPKYVSEYKKSMRNINDYEKFMRTLKKYEQYYKINFYNDISPKFIEKTIVKNIFNISSIEAHRNIEDITTNTRKYVKDKMIDNKEQLNMLNDNINNEIKGSLINVTSSIDRDIENDQTEIGIRNGRNDFVSTFEFDSDFTEFFKYELKNYPIGYTLPLDNNGLGYNNLIYIRNALNLKNEDEFNILLIEEPEAHLHPNMQYKLIKYIEKYKKNESNQVFITTHSSNITASAKIDDIILVDYKCDEKEQNVKCINLRNNFDSDYIKQEFNVEISQNELENNKRYLHKFLDVTRSDLLFADKVILVEGISEKIFVPYAFYKKQEEELVDKYISIIEVGGITFKNFLPLFLGTTKKVLCISDIDYIYSNLESYDICKYELERTKKLNTIGKEIYKDCQNYHFSTQKLGGSTFEKELFLENYEENASKILILVLPERAKQKLENYSNEVNKYDFWINKASTIIDDSHIWNSIQKLIDETNHLLEDDIEGKYKDKVEKIFLCELFYKYVKNRKGDFALDISINESDYIKHPQYILEGLEWIKE